MSMCLCFLVFYSLWERRLRWLKVRTDYDCPFRTNHIILHSLIFPLDTDYRAQEDILVKHIQEVRKVPGLQGARFIVIVESNLAFEAQRQTDMLLEYSRKLVIPEVVVMRENKGRPGLQTNEITKAEMAGLLDKSLRKARVLFHRNFVYTSHNPADTPARMREEYVRQLGNYKRIVVPALNNAYAAPKVLFSGKSGYAGGDDSAITIQLNLYGWSIFKRNTEYSKYWLKNNSR